VTTDLLLPLPTNADVFFLQLIIITIIITLSHLLFISPSSPSYSSSMLQCVAPLAWLPPFMMLTKAALSSIYA
jgi:hypothetical protein